MVNKCVYKVSSESASVAIVGYAVAKIIAKKRNHIHMVNLLRNVWKM